MIPASTIQQLFPSFDNELVAFISQKARTVEFKEGDFLMRTGQNIRAAILITKGLVKLFREDDEGAEFFMYYLQPGQACALSIICATKHETSQVAARAVEDTEAIALPIEYMDMLMREHKNWYYFVLETYRARFSELLVTIDHIAFRNMDERLVFYLKKQQQTLGSKMLTVSNTEIARELNSSREVISRLMKKLAEKGLIIQHKNHIEITKLAM
jgi:CRP/FNR family transcriptional regulator